MVPFHASLNFVVPGMSPAASRHICCAFMCVCCFCPLWVVAVSPSQVAWDLDLFSLLSLPSVSISIHCVSVCLCFVYFYKCPSSIQRNSDLVSLIFLDLFLIDLFVLGYCSAFQELFYIYPFSTFTGNDVRLELWCDLWKARGNIIKFTTRSALSRAHTSAKVADLQNVKTDASSETYG